MASPRSVSARSLATSERRYRRSAFNGARQLSAAQAPGRRILVLLVLLILALVAALAVIVKLNLSETSGLESSGPAVAPATHPASH